MYKMQIYFNINVFLYILYSIFDILTPSLAILNSLYALSADDYDFCWQFFILLFQIFFTMHYCSIINVGILQNLFKLYLPLIAISTTGSISKFNNLYLINLSLHSRPLVNSHILI